MRPTDEENEDMFRRIRERRAQVLTEGERNDFIWAMIALEKAVGDIVTKLWSSETMSLGQAEDHLYNLTLELERLGEGLHEKYPLNASSVPGEVQGASE